MPLSFSLPRQLLSVLVHEHATRSVSLLFSFLNPCPVQQGGSSIRQSPPPPPIITLTPLYTFFPPRIQEIKELGELPPQWEQHRYDVIEHCNNLIGSYQETLVQLDRLPGEYGKEYSQIMTLA